LLIGFVCVFTPLTVTDDGIDEVDGTRRHPAKQSLTLVAFVVVVVVVVVITAIPPNMFTKLVL
jgi:hypothetical protein